MKKKEKPTNEVFVKADEYTNPSSLNKAMLRDIQDCILSSPQNFDMGSVVCSPYTGEEEDEQLSELDVLKTFDVKKMKQGECGTTACIAGYALLLSGQAETDDWVRDAAKLLGFNYISDYAFCDSSDEFVNEEETSKLFIYSEWPNELREAFETAESPEARAFIAAARIQRVIDTESLD